MSFRSETQKYRLLTAPFCLGSGIDIASQGDPVVPWAWSFDLPDIAFLYYNSGNKPQGPIPLRGYADRTLPISSASLDFVYSSHLLEDFEEHRWNSILTEWSRVIKPGGYLIVVVPERGLWKAALDKGQPPNCSHRYEPLLGDLSRHAHEIGGLIVVQERLTNLFDGDYSILFVAEKT